MVLAVSLSFTILNEFGKDFKVEAASGTIVITAFNVPTYFPARQNVTFSASAQGYNTYSLAFWWNVEYRNGTDIFVFLWTREHAAELFEPSNSATHSFIANFFYAGEYRVSLTVKDGPNASTTAYQDITVSDPEDLILGSVEPVQVVDGASAMVKGKPTLIKTQIYSSFSESVTAKVKIQWADQTLYEDIAVPGNALTTYYLPSSQTIQFSQTGATSVSARIETVYSKTEADLGNNFNTTGIVVKDTDGFNIFYAFLGINGNPNMVKTSTDFIRDTYPVSPQEITCGGATISSIDPQCLTYDQRTNVFMNLSLARLWTQSKFVVGVVDENNLPADAAGASRPERLGSPGIPGAVVSGNNYFTNPAHEIGHQIGLHKYNEEYIRDPLGNIIYPGNIVKYYSIAERTNKSQICFMGTSLKGSVDRWIDQGCYEQLLSSLKLGADPEVLYVSGLIYPNETVKLLSWYHIPEGIPDFGPGNVGNYALVYLNSEGQELSQVQFDVDSSLENESNIRGFAFSIPYVEGTSKVLVKHNSEVIGQRIVSAHAPAVEVSYPNGEEMDLGKTYTVNWMGSDQDNDELKYTVLYSSDGGTNWVPLAFDLNQTSFVWNTAGLEAGSSFLVKVIASDGVNTGIDVSEEFTLASAPPPAISDLSSSVFQSSANQASFIYADPNRMTRAVATYDVAAGSIVYGMCQNLQDQGFDNNPLIVSQDLADKGRLLLQNKTVLMFGSRNPHFGVRYLEDKRLTPIYFQNDGSNVKLIENATGIDKVNRALSSIDFDHEDYFVLMALTDENGNSVFINYGFEWKGTWAAGMYLKAIYPNIQTYTNSYYIIHWQDTNNDGIPQTNEMTPIPT
jgi:hypothetical protein